jgi:hypothetical protein
MLARMVLPLSVVGMLFGSSSSSSGSTLTSLTAGGGSSSISTASAGSIKSALVNAEKNEAKQMEQVAKDPQIQKDLARYEKVVKKAKSLDEVLDDPVARKVFMTANGLKAYADYTGMAKKVLASDPTDSSSQAAKLSSITAAWYDTVQNYNIAEYGIDRLSPKMDGMAGRWRISLEREGEVIEAQLELKRVSGVWKAEVDGIAQPVTVDGENIELNLLWRDSTDEIRTSILKGTLDGETLTGSLTNDGSSDTFDWSAEPYFADAVAEVSRNYLAEKRLDMLDAQLPGLGSAVLFKQVAATLEDAIDILGSPLGREIITTAFSIPKQIAVQSMDAQEKAIKQRMNPAKLQDPHFVDMIAQRYLLMLNGGLGGITA